MQMQSTFSLPNGTVPGWTRAMQLQPVVQPAHTVHATQIQPAVQPSQTQLMVVHPSNQVQYQVQMNQAGWSNQQLNTAQMTMACQTWKSDKKVPTEGDWCRWQQENVRLQQHYQLLHSEYQAALVQIQTLTLQQTELNKKLKMDQMRFHELNNKYMMAIQVEQNNYNVLRNLHNETSNQLRSEQGKCNALSIELEVSKKNLKNEQQKYEVLSAIHAETKKNLHSMQQKRDQVGNLIDNKGKSASDVGKYDAPNPILSREIPLKPTLNESRLEHVPVGLNLSSTVDPIQSAGASASSEISNRLVIPPGFERCTRVSGQGVGKTEE